MKKFCLFNYYKECCENYIFLHLEQFSSWQWQPQSQGNRRVFFQEKNMAKKPPLLVVLMWWFANGKQQPVAYQKLEQNRFSPWVHSPIARLPSWPPPWGCCSGRHQLKGCPLKFILPSSSSEWLNFPSLLSSLFPPLDYFSLCLPPTYTRFLFHLYMYAIPALVSHSRRDMVEPNNMIC